MRRKLVGLAVTALLISTTARSAAAQARGYFGVGAGLVLPMGSFKSCCKMGWEGQVIAGITGPKGVIGGRIDGNYSQNSVKGTGGGKLKLLGVNADVVFTPHSASKVHPYLLGGLGFYNNKEGAFSETKLAFNGGGGLKFETSSNMSVYTELRYISVRATGGSLNFIPIVIGLRWGGI